MWKEVLLREYCILSSLWTSAQGQKDLVISEKQCLICVFFAGSVYMGLFGDNRFVDLGLSVRWAKCNIGASAPYEIGGLYAWGETKTKSAYRQDTSMYYREKGFDNS